MTQRTFLKLDTGHPDYRAAIRRLRNEPGLLMFESRKVKEAWLVTKPNHGLSEPLVIKETTDGQVAMEDAASLEFGGAPTRLLREFIS